jgi:hypothetical protein
MKWTTAAVTSSRMKMQMIGIIYSKVTDKPKRKLNKKVTEIVWTV